MSPNLLRSYFTLLELVFRVSYTLPYLFVSGVMSAILRCFSQRLDFYKESNAPLDTDGSHPYSGEIEKEWTDIWNLLKTPIIVLSDVPAYLDVKNLNTIGLDDRQLLLEKVLVLMSRTQDFNFSMRIQQAVIDLLYKDLPHPPSGYLCLPPQPAEPGTSVLSEDYNINYAFRTSDGSNNNPLYPALGKAGYPYARSVSSIHNLPKSSLPEAGLVFDVLLKRESFKGHPGGISALFFSFADLVIHSIFNTSRKNPAINNASSYLDLSVLYGSSDAEVNSVRKNDGTGKLLDDVFADSRLLMMPPASCALLILLNRNHNYIAQRILDINENGNLQNPIPTDPATRQRQDDEIFNRSRLVNCGYFMHIILGDYVGAILGLIRDGSDWRLNPLMAMRESDHSVSPRGEGNVVSIEFNLLYRWHATLSEPDTKWITGVFEGIFDGTDPKDVTASQFVQAAHKHLIPPKDVRNWTFGGLKRDNGRFKDKDLADILHMATETRAGAFGARGIPEALKVVEVMAIEQSRNWGVCSLNEFRKFLGLKPYSTFKEWNPDPNVHAAAAALYKDIDNLELHVGLQAEETKATGPGAGLCPGYTISRAILADAVSLTRGDRFMTVEMTPYNLTNWGYQDCQYDLEDGSYGGLLTKLLFRTLPDYYPRGSSYAHFPFLQTSWMKAHLAEYKPELGQKYSWDRPVPVTPAIPIDSFEDVQQLLGDRKSYISAHNSRLWTLVRPVLEKTMDTGTFVQKAEKTRNALETANLRFVPGASALSDQFFKKIDSEYTSYFSKKTQDLINEKSLSFLNDDLMTLDIVKDVINLLPVYWISEEIGLPLKTSTNRKGIWYEQEVYNKFANVTQYVYLNFDPVNDWKWREVSQVNVDQLTKLIESHINEAKISIHDPINYLSTVNENKTNSANLKTLWHMRSAEDKHCSTREFAAQVIVALVPTAALFSQAVSHVVDYYLSEDRRSIREEITRLFRAQEDGATEKIMGYVYKALQFNPPITGVYRTVVKDTILGYRYLKTGDHVFADILGANRDASVFGINYTAIDDANTPENPINLAFSDGFLTAEFLKATVPAILNSIFSLDELKRAANKTGVLETLFEKSQAEQGLKYISQQGLVIPLPDSLVIQFRDR